MAFVAFEDCLAIHVRGLFSSAPWENTFYGRKASGTVTQADCDAVADAIDLVVDSDGLALWSSSVSYVETYVRDLTAQISFQATSTVSAGPGTAVGTPVESHSCAVLIRDSGFVGRSARGRIYLPGGVSGHRTDANSWDTAWLDLGVAYCEAIDAALVTEGFVPVIVSPTLRVSTGQTLLSTFEIVTWRYANDNIAAMRNRS